ncbi:hypothetical protein WJN01_12265 [Flavobacteriaceae bacterium SZ-1-7]|uniref:hypothetical protein n=1 Tax=Tamlana sedimenti TaxID=3134126 RepID=UPI003122DA28
MKYTILILLICSKLTAQSITKYFDLNGKEITSEKFNENRVTKKTVYGYHITDTISEYRIVNRSELGKLDKQTFDTLKSMTKPSEQKEFWIYIFYPGVDRCNKIGRKSTWNIFQDDFELELNKIGTYEIQWLAKTQDNNLRDYTNSKTSWKIDPAHFFESTFFNLHYPCFSSVIVDKEGNYVINKAEFGKNQVWDAVKKLKKLKRNN